MLVPLKIGQRGRDLDEALMAIKEVGRIGLFRVTRSAGPALIGLRN